MRQDRRVPSPRPRPLRVPRRSEWHDRDAHAKRRRDPGHRVHITTPPLQGKRVHPTTTSLRLGAPTRRHTARSCTSGCPLSLELVSTLTPQQGNPAQPSYIGEIVLTHPPALGPSLAPSLGPVPRSPQPMRAPSPKSPRSAPSVQLGLASSLGRTCTGGHSPGPATSSPSMPHPQPPPRPPPGCLPRVPWRTRAQPSQIEAPNTTPPNP